jgi:hypothetical protein
MTRSDAFGEFFAVCGACTQNTDKPNEDWYRM